MKKNPFLLPVIAMMLFLMLGSVNVKADTTLEEYRYTNPAYEDLEWNTDLDSAEIDTYGMDARSGVQYTSDKQSLIKTFRQQLVNREPVITLYYHCNQQITQKFFDSLSAELFDGAIAHTGVGKEGDYIKWHWQGWNAGADYSTNRNGGYDMKITYTVSYLSSASQEAQMDKEVSKLLASFNLSNKSDYEKVKAIYDYMCSNITYDYANLNNDAYTLKHTAYAALIDKTAVCQGYATLFYRLALESGVDTRVITGDSGGPHAWNIVKLNGKYYNLDSTWDAGLPTYFYFLKSMNDFAEHARDGEYLSADFSSAYPMADKSYQEFGEQKPVEEEHDYGEPLYVWAADHTTITAGRVCKDDPSHIEQETATATKEVIKEPTCTEKGSAIYRAVFENPAFEAQEEVVEENALGHNFKNGVCTRCNAKITGRWIKSGSRWWYRYEDGSFPKNGLYKIGNTWYGFDAAGWMKTGWAAYSGYWYYFAPSGAMKTGWFAEQKTWYYLKADGKMAKGWLKVDGAWYYFNGSGKMAKGFITVGDGKYYMNGSGRMVTGWQKLNGYWYYFTSSGKMATGWQKIGGKWYYLKADGKMAANTWVGNWYVNGSGVWVKSR